MIVKCFIILATPSIFLITNLGPSSLNLSLKLLPRQYFWHFLGFFS